MQNKIIIYEPIEFQKDIEPEDLEIFQNLKDNNINNLEVYVEFFEE